MAKKTITKKSDHLKVIYSDTRPQNIEWRIGVFDCPHCDHKFDLSEWKNSAITLVVGKVCGKHNSIVMISECPNCFEKSWCHFELNCFHYESDKMKEKYSKWIDIMEQEDQNRRIGACRELVNSLCGKCKHLESIQLNTSTYINCKHKSGPVTLDNDFCSSFEHY